VLELLTIKSPLLLQTVMLGLGLHLVLKYLTMKSRKAFFGTMSLCSQQLVGTKIEDYYLFIQ
jgi:hypothetical protein